MTIFLALANFANISNVLRGKCIRALAERFRVVVLTEYIDEESAERDGYFRSPRVRYVRWRLRYPLLWRASNVYLRMPFIREFDRLWSTRYWVYGRLAPVDRTARLLELIGRLLPARFPPVHWFTALERRLLAPPREFMDLVREERPRLLASATPGYMYAPLDAELIVFAHRLGVPTAAIDVTFDNLVNQAKFVRKTDYLAVWNDQMKEEAMRYQHYAPSSVAVTGSLKFDHYVNDVAEGRLKSREDFLRAKGLDPAKRLVVYATPAPATYSQRRELMEALVAMKRRGRLDGDPNLLVRLHPHDVWESYCEFAGIPGIHIERAGVQRLPDTGVKGQRIEMVEDDLVNLTDTLRHADILINFASTLIIEACIFGTPTVSLGFPWRDRGLDQCEGTKELMELAGEPVAESPEELADIINRYLADPSRASERCRAVVEHFVQFADGLAYRRIADFLEGIIRKPRP